MNEDGTLKIEYGKTDDGIDNVDIIVLKCNYCSKEVIRFSYYDGKEEILDKKAIIVCSGCKGKLI